MDRGVANFPNPGAKYIDAYLHATIYCCKPFDNTERENNFSVCSGPSMYDVQLGALFAPADGRGHLPLIHIVTISHDLLIVWKMEQVKAMKSLK